MPKRHHVGNVSIFKPSRSPFWTAYYRDNGGRQKTRSLKTRNLNVAKVRARALDTLLQQGDEGRLEALQRNRAITFDEGLARFLGERTDGAVGRGASWAETTRRSTSPLLEKLRTTWADRPIHSIRYADILEFLGAHTAVKQKSSWNRYRSTIRSIFAFFVEAEYIPRSPAAPLRFEKVPKRAPKALSDDEYRAVVEHVPDYARVIVQLLVDTGLRRSQLFRLEWRDVDTTNRELTIRDPKDREDMTLPIPQRTAALFDRLRPGTRWKRRFGLHRWQWIEWPSDANPSALVIPFIDIKKSLHRAAQKAQLGEGRTVTPHMLRHTWATRHRRAGTPLDRLMELGGWDSYEMVLRYADVPADLRESTDRLEQFPQ